MDNQGATGAITAGKTPLSGHIVDTSMTMSETAEGTAMRLMTPAPAPGRVARADSGEDHHSVTDGHDKLTQGSASDQVDLGQVSPISVISSDDNMSHNSAMSQGSTTGSSSAGIAGVSLEDTFDMSKHSGGPPPTPQSRSESKDTSLVPSEAGSTDLGTVATAASTSMETQGSAANTTLPTVLSPRSPLLGGAISTTSSSSGTRTFRNNEDEPTPKPTVSFVRRSDTIRQKVREKEEHLAALVARKSAVSHQRKAKEEVRKKVRENEERLSALMKKQTSQAAALAVVPSSPQVSASSVEGSPGRVGLAKEKREKVRESEAKISTLMDDSRQRTVEIDIKEKEELDRKEAVRALAKVALELKGELHLAQKREKALERDLKHQERSILLAQAEKVELCHELLSLRAEVSQHEAAMETLQQTLELTHNAHERLKEELERARSETTAFVPTALETVIEATEEDDSLTNPASLLWSQQKQEELEALEYQWTKKNAEYDGLLKTLQDKQKKIIELEVELDLLCFESEGELTRIGSSDPKVGEGGNWSKELETIQEELGAMLSATKSNGAAENDHSNSAPSPEMSSQEPSTAASSASPAPKNNSKRKSGSKRAKSKKKENKKKRKSTSPSSRSRFGWLRRSGKRQEAQTPEPEQKPPEAPQTPATEAPKASDGRRYQRLKERYKKDKLQHKLAMDQLAAENKDCFLKIVALENSLHRKHSSKGPPTALDGSLSRSQDDASRDTSKGSYNFRGAPVDVYEADAPSEPSEVVEKLVLWDRTGAPAVNVVRQPSLPNKAKYWEERAVELAHESSVKSKTISELEAKLREENQKFEKQRDDIKTKLEQLQWQHTSKSAQLEAMESVMEQQTKKSDRSVVVRADLWTHLNSVASLETKLRESLDEVAYWRRQHERKDHQLAKLQKNMAELRYKMNGKTTEAKNSKVLSPILEINDDAANNSALQLSSSTKSGGSGSLLSDTLTAEEVVEEMNSTEAWEDLRLTYQDPARQASF